MWQTHAKAPAAPAALVIGRPLPEPTLAPPLLMGEGEGKMVVEKRRAAMMLTRQT
jgi:hypothetical protein